MRTNVYIDGLNLYNGVVGSTPYKWLNPQVLVQALLPGVSISRIRYFTARVVSFPHDPDAPTRQRVYLRALETLPNLSITEGQFKKRMPWYPQFPLVYANGADPRSEPPLMVQVVRYEEKRTDVNLAAYLLADCFNGEYDQAVVISNDSDLALPIRMVRDDFGKEVVVVCPLRRAAYGVRELDEASTRMIHSINASHLAASQFPDEVIDAKGTFRKPRGW